MTTSEYINLLDSKCHGGNVAIKLDITKAFDTLSWEFLIHVLEAFWFQSDLCYLGATCLLQNSPYWLMAGQLVISLVGVVYVKGTHYLLYSFAL